MDSHERSEINCLTKDKAFELILGVSVDSLKLLYDLMKHIATLSSGSLILLASLLPQITAKGHFSLMLGLSFLVIGLGAAIYAMFHIAVLMRGLPGETADQQKMFTKSSTWTMIVAFSGFTAGLAQVVIATIFYRQ